MEITWYDIPVFDTTRQRLRRVENEKRPANFVGRFMRLRFYARNVQVCQW